MKLSHLVYRVIRYWDPQSKALVTFNSHEQDYLHDPVNAKSSSLRLTLHSLQEFLWWKSTGGKLFWFKFLNNVSSLPLLDNHLHLDIDTAIFPVAPIAGPPRWRLPVGLHPVATHLAIFSLSVTFTLSGVSSIYHKSRLALNSLDKITTLCCLASIMGSCV